MGVNLEAETNFLQSRVNLLLAGFTCLDSSFVLVLTEVHEFTHRRLSVRCNFNQVKIRFARQTQCIFNANDAYLFAARSDKSYFRNTDSFIDTGIANDKAPVLDGGETLNFKIVIQTKKAFVAYASEGSNTPLSTDDNPRKDLSL